MENPVGKGYVVWCRLMSGLSGDQVAELWRGVEIGPWRDGGQ